MYRSTRACPHCFGVLVHFRSRPSPFPRILGFQLWRCPECKITFEAANTITRESLTSESKGWIYRIEATEESRARDRKRDSKPERVKRHRELRQKRKSRLLRRGTEQETSQSDSHSESDGESTDSYASERRSKPNTG